MARGLYMCNLNMNLNTEMAVYSQVDRIGASFNSSQIM